MAKLTSSGVQFNLADASDSINSFYWIEGSYVNDAMKEIDYFMRDWRQNKVRPYDPANIDILSATQGLLDSSEPFYLLSGYRTRKTNKRPRESGNLCKNNGNGKWKSTK